MAKKLAFGGLTYPEHLMNALGIHKILDWKCMPPSEVLPSHWWSCVILFVSHFEMCSDAPKEMWICKQYVKHSSSTGDSHGRLNSSSKKPKTGHFAARNVRFKTNWILWFSLFIMWSFRWASLRNLLISHQYKKEETLWDNSSWLVGKSLVAPIGSESQAFNIKNDRGWTYINLRFPYMRHSMAPSPLV